LARKILLADDSVTAQNMGRKILADAGYEVITVNNGSAALKKIGEQRPDLIVLDVYMPGYSGLEVCQRLKETGETSRIPILLTVGKLEPFKPEEAKRVRADGYIVKPFEASELLSALSKLEDRVVPRGESAKTGRFARATAALDEGRYDKSMAVEEDAGWKNRISFPSKKKKEKPVEVEVETGEIYNAVNKDLRTVVDHKKAEPAPSASTAPGASENTKEAHVNLGALAPEGLPNNVTPEEIAALAAAAAQIQGTVADTKPTTPAAEVSATAPTQEPSKTLSTEAKTESKEEVPTPGPAPVPEVAATAPATFAEQESKEEIEEKKAEPAIVSTQADAMKAIMGLETQVMAAISPESGNGSGTYPKTERTDEPMTMAAAASADTSSAAASRWTAVAVALGPDDAAVSLEQEMQKAYADFAAAESGHAAAVIPSPETSAAVAEAPAAPAANTDSPVAEPASPIPATPAPDVAQPLAAVSEAVTEAMSAAVKELEVVAAKYESDQTPASEPVTDKSLQAAALESPSPASSEATLTPEPKAEDKIESKLEEKGEARVEEKVEDKIEAKVEEPERTTVPSPQDIASAVTTVFAIPQFRSEPVPETQVAAPHVEASKEREAEPVIEAAEPAAKMEAADEKSSTEEPSTELVPVSSASRARGVDDMAKRESETAAAWESWRRIRETGSKPSGEADSQEVPQDRAAMAAAAGAEGKPVDVTALDSDPEISSLVDSVLADMRPKIVEEIARKLGKKK
jgi:CheY-like chemotaxis protein